MLSKFSPRGKIKHSFAFQKQATSPFYLKYQIRLFSIPKQPLNEDKFNQKDENFQSQKESFGTSIDEIQSMKPDGGEHSSSWKEVSFILVFVCHS
jgi:hypothetical protein